MADSDELVLRSLRGRKWMPLPTWPKVTGYGYSHVGSEHDIQLFPAVVQRIERKMRAHKVSDPFVGGDVATCFFHTKREAVAVCEVSGRMICDLCKTEYDGKVVSFDVLSGLVESTSGKKKKNANFVVSKPKQYVRWDDICLALAIFPLIFFFVTVLTAPAVLVLTLMNWRKGPTSPIRKTRFRYIVACLIALIQITFWGLALVGIVAGAGGTF